MTPEEIKKGAPLQTQKYLEDYCDGEVWYFKFDGYDVFQFIDDEWCWVDNFEDQPDYYDELKPL